MPKKELKSNHESRQGESRVEILKPIEARSIEVLRCDQTGRLTL